MMVDRLQETAEQTDPHELSELYAMYCAVVRSPNCVPGYANKRYEAFRLWWLQLGAERTAEEERLRLAYKQVLKDDLKTGMQVIRKYLVPEPKMRRDPDIDCRQV